MDHSELIQEMVLLEKMTAQERLKHARRRRQQQLKNWMQREAATSNGTTVSNSTTIKPTKLKTTSVKFPLNVVLLEASARQDIEEVRNLLQSGNYSPNTANEDGLTPIHQCSIDNSEKLLRLLIEYGGDVNAKDRDLWTPLHAAATCGHLQICRVLVENGAELLSLNADGNMPYDICDDDITLDYIETQMDRIGITQEMIDKTRTQVENQMLVDLQTLVKKKSQGSSRSIDDILSHRNTEGVTPLHIASANGYQSVVEYLLKQHVSINLQDSDGWTPTHAAAFWCQQSILTQLINAGADIYEKIPDGRSAVDLCDDPDLRSYMVDLQEQNLRNQEKAAAAAAAAAAAQLQQKLSNRLQVNTNSLPNGGSSRIGTLYESRSSVSSPYGSGSSLNRTSSIRRASLRDREKVKKLNENFFEVLQAKDKIQEDVDEGLANSTVNNGTLSPVTAPKLSSKEEHMNSIATTLTESTGHEPITVVSAKKSPVLTNETTLPPLKAPPPPLTQSSADTLSDVKRRREERRRGLNGSLFNDPSVATSPPLPPPLADTNHKSDSNNHHHHHLQVSNGCHDSKDRYISPKQVHLQHTIDDDREKRICCTIL